MIYVLSKNKKNITIFHLKFIIFTCVDNCSILHMRVIFMNLGLDPCQFSVSLYGLGGLSLHHRHLTSFDLAHKYEIKNSDIAYIDLGSNDA